jgi:hypothetical protein
MTVSSLQSWGVPFKEFGNLVEGTLLTNVSGSKEQADSGDGRDL